jgi:pimeloyl-ACP methyl ester carboxylesterase
VTALLVRAAPTTHATSVRTVRPLVLVHGVSSGPGCWDRVAAAMGARRKLVLVDLYDRPNGLARFTLRAAASDLAGKLEERHIHGAVLAGHSMGGLIGISLAAERPDLVRALVLVDTPALPLPGGVAGRAAAIARSTGRTDPGSLPMLVSGLWRMGAVRLWYALDEILRAELAPALDGLALPTLLVWGASDTIVPVEVGREMALRIPRARLVLIGGAGHMPMWERASEFTAELESFLDEVDATG